METDRAEAPSNHEVHLREVTHDDLPVLFEHQLDPEASRMAAFPSRDEDAFMAHWTRILGDPTVLARTVVFEGQVAGNVVSWGDADEREVGYWIGREFWGKGIATKALGAFLNVETRRPLFAHVAGHNLASIRVLEKCGFQLGGEDSWSHADGTNVNGLVLKLGSARSEVTGFRPLAEVEAVHRPAARVVCVDPEQNILLLRWRDPLDGAYLWEPPGGGLEPGELLVDAARRELEEETGLPPNAVLDQHVMVERDVWWNGQHFVGEEAFFLARVADGPSVRTEGLKDYEAAWLQGHAWVHWSKIANLSDRVEPPDLLRILGVLDPTGPWRS